MFERAKWIGVPRSELQKWNILQGDLNNRFAYFTLDVPLYEPGSLKIQISAVARYRLWINGQSVLSGSCKGDRYRQYYEEIDVSEYLRVGNNRFAVQVLACDSYIVNNMMKNGQQPLLAYAGLPLGHRLAVEGVIYRKRAEQTAKEKEILGLDCAEEGSHHRHASSMSRGISEENALHIGDTADEPLADVTTGEAPWKVYLEGSYQLEYQQPYLTWFGAIAECIPENAIPFRWKVKDDFVKSVKNDFVKGKTQPLAFGGSTESGGSDADGFVPTKIQERDARLTASDPEGFVPAETLEAVKVDCGNTGAGNIGALVMKEREVPFMYEKRKEFQRQVSFPVGRPHRFALEDIDIPTVAYGYGLARTEDVPDVQCGVWVPLWEKPMRIEKNTVREWILDAGELTTAYVKFPFSGGKGTKVSFTYAERFTEGETTGGTQEPPMESPCNGEVPDRTPTVDDENVAQGNFVRLDDAVNGSLEGFHDSIVLSGESFTYEPFWYRTFRFIRVRVETGSEEAVVGQPYFLECGYPLDVQTHVESSEAWVGDVWKICVNTLRRCMNETYMDCPYYEQMQFPMDTRLQALYTYICSGDVRLAKKALLDFHCSMTPDGLIQGKYPCSHTQIISTFSLHYLFMLKEYYLQTGDLETLKRYRPDVDLILDYYDRKIDQDLVENLGYWEFVDWKKEWATGAPAATEHGPSTIINLMYAYALSCGAYIFEVTGRPGVAREYRERQQRILQAVEEKCWSEERGMYREGPDFEQYSVHAQAWAVLNGMKSGAEVEDGEKTAVRLDGDKEMPSNGTSEAAALMERALTGADVIQCTFSTSFEVFEALYQCGQYRLAEEMFSLWKELPAKGCTTCPEVPENTRSECHAWSAQPIYEFTRHVLGITVEEPGWVRIRIAPELSFIRDLKGEVITPKGILKFALKRTSDGLETEFDIPEGIQAKLFVKK